jgi:hypothetical protein
MTPHIDEDTLKQIVADQSKNDDEILQEILDQFQEFEEALEDVMDGIINPLIVKGPPGTGKSESVAIASKQAGIKSVDLISSQWEKATKDEIKEGTHPLYPYKCLQKDVIDGALMRGADYGVWQLVTDLYANKDEGLLCLDDNDDILKDNVAMALLMKATEQKSSREITYGKAASTDELLIRGVESRFNTKCPIIILSNIDFDKHIQHANQKESQTGKPAPSYIKRWEALMHSRGKFIDLKMNTPKRIRIYCEHTIRKHKILENSTWLIDTFGKALTNKESEEVLAWVRKNQSHLKTRLDLRTYNKVAAKYLRRPEKFEESARIDFLKLAA